MHRSRRGHTEGGGGGQRGSVVAVDAETEKERSMCLFSFK